MKKLLNQGLGWIGSMYKEPIYNIKAGYFHRSEVVVFDDSTNTDEWQKEVYLYCKELLHKEGYSKIIDFGCGSGFKLMQHFADYDTLGIELENAVDKLKSKYPQKKWMVFDETQKYSCDILIMSDVIEHVKSPSKMLKSIDNLIDFKVLIISTPDRNLLKLALPYGPPRNISHFREWSYDEFSDFMSMHFDVKNHFISNEKQATQVIECTKRKIS